VTQLFKLVARNNPY